MAVVYRYENKDGIGPFHGHSKISYHQHFVGSVCPSPFYDGLYDFIPGRMKCGCRDRKELRHWFRREFRRIMKEEGFHLAIYTVPDEDVFIGSVQVVFIPYNAKVTRHRALSH